MPVINVALKDLPGVLRRDLVTKREAILRAVRTAVKTWGPRLAQEMIANTSPQPVDRGTYKRGFRAEETPDGVVFYNPVAYAGVIEEGRRPGSPMPPLDVIEAWVLRKGLVKGSNRKADARHVAWLVARKIAARGIPAKRVMARVRVKLDQQVQEAIRAAVAGSAP